MHPATEKFRPIEDARPRDEPWRAMKWPPPSLLTGDVVELVPCVPQEHGGVLFSIVAEDWRAVREKLRTRVTQTGVGG
jgi:hypothetical protein